MSDLPRFTVRPPLRCCAQVTSRASRVCGEVAYWQTPPLPGTLPAYHCAVHRAVDDEPISPAVIFRRVSVTAEMVFAGAGQASAEARADVLERLEAAVVAAGGLFNLHVTSETVGRWEPPVRSKAGRPRRDHAEV